MKVKQIIKALKKFEPDSSVRMSFKKSQDSFVYLTVDKIDSCESDLSNGDVGTAVLLESEEDYTNPPDSHFYINNKVCRIYSGGNKGE